MSQREGVQGRVDLLLSSFASSFTLSFSRIRRGLPRRGLRLHQSKSRRRVGSCQSESPSPSPLAPFSSPPPLSGASDFCPSATGPTSTTGRSINHPAEPEAASALSCFVVESPSECISRSAPPLCLLPPRMPPLRPQTLGRVLRASWSCHPLLCCSPLPSPPRRPLLLRWGRPWDCRRDQRWDQQRPQPRRQYRSL